MRAADATVVGLPSNTDVATTILFTDNPLISQTTLIRAVHLTELRTAVNAVLAAAGLSAATFTDTITAGVPIRAVHFTELRTALDAARSAIGLSALTYTDPGLTAGTTAAAAPVRELGAGGQRGWAEARLNGFGSSAFAAAGLPPLLDKEEFQSAAGGGNRPARRLPSPLRPFP